MTTPQETTVNLSFVEQWRPVALGTLWLGFVTYAFFLAPPSAPDTIETITQLSTGQWAELNPVVVVLFNFMGLWPVVYAVFGLSDGREQTVPAWPFVMGSFALGAFALMPYLAMRKSTAHLPYRSNDSALLKGLNHRFVGMGIVIACILLGVYGISNMQVGTLQTFYGQFVSSQFIHAMSLDFCMLTLLTPSIMWDDMTRRRVPDYWRSLSLIPLLGPGLYLALRPVQP